MFFKKPMMRHVKDVRTGQSLFCKKPPKFTTATFASLLFRLSLKRKVCRRSLRLSLAPGSIRIFLASYCSSNLVIKSLLGSQGPSWALSSAATTCVSSECCTFIISLRVATVAMRAVKQMIGDGQKSACSRKFLNQSTVIEQPAWLIHRMTKMTTQSTGHVRNIAKYCGFVEK